MDDSASWFIQKCKIGKVFLREEGYGRGEGGRWRTGTDFTLVISMSWAAGNLVDTIACQAAATLQLRGQSDSQLQGARTNNTELLTSTHRRHRRSQETQETGGRKEALPSPGSRLDTWTVERWTSSTLLSVNTCRHQHHHHVWNYRWRRIVMSTEVCQHRWGEGGGCWLVTDWRKVSDEWLMTGWLALDVFTPPPTLLLTMGALNTLLSPTSDLQPSDNMQPKEEFRLI